MFIRLTARLRAAGNHLRVAWHAWHDPATRWPGKLGLVAMALYLLSPFDLLPDWIPLLGWIDDLMLISIVLPLFLRLLPADVLLRAQRRAGMTVR
jgi:uncharacterized membrane protein YkvA (DUF1232 family)